MSQGTINDVEDIPIDEDSVHSVKDIYEPNNFVSMPFLSESCTLPENVVEFQHSFGYTCKKYFNLCVMDETILVFISGNLLHFYDVDTEQLSFRRSAGGCGLGHLTRNPKLSHLAVGEKGENPLIIIYEWPLFSVVCVLRDGTKKEYTYLNYSSDGDLLLSQGGDPDYMLTIWDWRNATALLRGQSYTQDVINARFSNYVPGHLTTSGYGHIKFWKMAQTFTGLKLKGALGRFGKTEICDIIGFLAMPDEKVVSGCEWGNILLWEEGLIKAEICRRNRVPCHTAPITQFEFDQNELTSIGLDGMIKMWYFETIALADPPEHDSFIEIEPMFQCKIECSGAVASIMSMVKKVDRPDNHFWYAQDANGGIWKVDLNIDYANEQPKQLLVCHAGRVMDMATSPCGPYLVTLGEDGRLFFYNYIDKKLLFTKQFLSEGRALIWLPRNVVKAGNVLAAGFSDGVIRVLVSSLREFEKSRNGAVEAVMLVQVIKPHTKPITVLSINPSGSVLVSGSEDNTIFVHKILRKNQHVSLVPIGFIEVPDSVTFIDWKPNRKTRVLVSCLSGRVLEIPVPEHPQPGKVQSFHLTPVDVLEIHFQSIKSQIRHDIRVAEIERLRQEELERKKEELDKFRKENPDAEIDEEQYLEVSDSIEELEPLYFPPEPNPVLFATYLTTDVVWLSMGGYDAGYMYQYRLGQSEPFKSTMIADADDVEIHSFVYNHNKNYLVFGMQNGQIRVNRINPNDPSDLTDYWLYSMHDNTNGIIHRLCFSYDQHYLFSCGDDGNIFSYTFNVPPDDYPEKTPMPTEIFTYKVYERVDDVDGNAIYSLEEGKNKAEQDQKLMLAEVHKQKVKAEVLMLVEKYKNIISRNNALPEMQRLAEHELEVHPSITTDLNDSIVREMELQMKKLAYDVEKSRLGLAKVTSYFFDSLDCMTAHVFACRSDSYVTTFRLRKLLDEFYEARKHVKVELAKKEHEGWQWQEMQLREVLPLQESALHAVDSFLKGLSLSSIEYKHNLKLVKAVERYRTRKLKMERRKHEWNELHNSEPDKSVIHPDDVALIAEAEQTVGDYKLKTSPDYKVPEELQMNIIQKYEQILDTREQEFKIKHYFNQEVYMLRSRKLSLIENINSRRQTLISIRQELSVPQKKAIPELPSVNEELEFPEKFLEMDLKEIMGKSEEVHEVGKQGTEVPVDWQLEMLTSHISPDRSIFEVPQEEFQMLSRVSVQQLTELTRLQDSSSAWEVELSRARNLRKLYEQEVILHETAYSINQFDNDVKKLAESKLQLEVDAKFLSLYLVQLNQELDVFNIFDDSEHDCASKVHAKNAEKNDTHIKIQDLQNRMNDTMFMIEAVKNRLLANFASFEELRTGNIFSEYLTKIFMRKYKPPQKSHVGRRKGSDEDSEHDTDSDEDSPMDETSTEDEDDDFDDDPLSTGRNVVKLDEGICPEGLDVEVYNQTFVLRQKRHEAEQQLLEHNTSLDGIKKELEIANNTTKLLKEALMKVLKEMETIQKEKQKLLNNVECVVLMNLDRLFLIDEQPSMQKLVFFQQVMTQLQARPEEIEQEKEEQGTLNHQYQRNLHQLHLDYKVMNIQIEKLKEEAQKCMERKFGRKIDLRELEEAVLRCLVAEMKSSAKDVTHEYNVQLKEMQEKLRQKQEILSFVVQENTEKLNLLTILEEEKDKLDNILQLQQHKLEHASIDRETEYLHDIQKLENIVKNQAQKIKHLQDEIRHLTYKSRPPVPAIPCPPISTAESRDSGKNDHAMTNIQHLAQDLPRASSDEEEKSVMTSETASNK